MIDLFGFLEGLTISQGRLAGEKLKLMPYQRRFLKGFLRTEGDCSLSLGRGGGKSTFIAGIALSALDGPLTEPNSEVVVAASSFDQARIVFQHCLAFKGEEIERDRQRWRLEDSANRAKLTDRKTGTSLRCIGSDPRRMHGLAPRLVIGDELSQFEPNKIGPALAALQTSMGKIPGARAIWIGTRPSAPNHPFERFLQGGAEYAQIHAAPAGLPPFQKRAWLQANPSLRYMPDLEKVIRREAARARKDPMALAYFSALRLNRGVSDSIEAMLCSAEVWMQAEVTAPDREGPYIVGLDLGTNASLSGVSGYWPGNGYAESFAVVPFEPDLHSRGVADGVGNLYSLAEEHGELIRAGERVADIPALLREVLERWGPPAAIACDRWRMAELLQSLEAVGFPKCALSARGQGYKDGGEDCRLFKAALLDGKLRPRQGLLTRASVGGARLSRDPAGSEKLRKTGHAKARDDIASALILAVAEGRRRAAAGRIGRKKTRYRIV